jgi:hypothetical protein
MGAATLMGCTSEPEIDPTVPPQTPTHQLAGSVLPNRVAGYTAQGQAPVAGQSEVTYASDADSFQLAVVTLGVDQSYAKTELTNSSWYGLSRCGVLWTGSSKVTPRPTQAACITHLVDGLMTSVSGGNQSPSELADLANAIYDGLASA